MRGGWGWWWLVPCASIGCSGIEHSPPFLLKLCRCAKEAWKRHEGRWGQDVAPCGTVFIFSWETEILRFILWFQSNKQKNNNKHHQTPKQTNKQNLHTGIFIRILVFDRSIVHSFRMLFGWAEVLFWSCSGRGWNGGGFCVFWGVIESPVLLFRTGGVPLVWAERLWRDRERRSDSSVHWSDVSAWWELARAALSSKSWCRETLKS